MTEYLDLLGDPVIRRTAFFPRPGIRRTLGRRWGPGPIACVIGCNPSDAGEARDDPTSLWWNRWFEHWGFGGYDGVNFYPFITSDPRQCRERVRAAFAGDWNESVLEEIQTGIAPWPDLWCWGTTKSGAPTHPMARGRHRIDPLQPAILWRAA